MTIQTALPTRVIVFPADVDVSQIPRRPYDFNRGDRRFFDQSAAIEHATATAKATGVRQIVRPDIRPLDKDRLFLVQAVGS